MGKKSKGGADIIGKIPKGIWLLISFVVAMLVWTILSITPPWKIVTVIIKKVARQITIICGVRPTPTPITTSGT